MSHATLHGTIDIVFDNPLFKWKQGRPQERIVVSLADGPTIPELATNALRDSVNHKRTMSDT